MEIYSPNTPPRLDDTVISQRLGDGQTVADHIEAHRAQDPDFSELAQAYAEQAAQHPQLPGAPKQ